MQHLKHSPSSSLVPPAKQGHSAGFTGGILTSRCSQRTIFNFVLGLWLKNLWSLQEIPKAITTMFLAGYIRIDSEMHPVLLIWNNYLKPGTFFNTNQLYGRNLLFRKCGEWFSVYMFLRSQKLITSYPTFHKIISECYFVCTYAPQILDLTH